MPRVAILDSTMHYLDDGDGASLVFLHGNCGSAHIWRNVLPRVGDGRLLAPDLIGMGGSGKPDITYLFADHARYLDAWMDALCLDNVILIGHDWGGALACDWAARHPSRVRALALVESIIKPMTWEELQPWAQARCEAIKTPGVGEDMILRQDLYIRQAFTGGGGVVTSVTDDDMDTYLAPYSTPDSRRPILAWARQIPLDGQPAEVVGRIVAYDLWLKASLDVPKLLLTFHGSPTLLVGAAMTAWCAANIASLEIVSGGIAGHFAPEDRPQEIAHAISTWVDRHHLRREESCKQ